MKVSLVGLVDEVEVTTWMKNKVVSLSDRCKYTRWTVFAETDVLPSHSNSCEKIFRIIAPPYSNSVMSILLTWWQFLFYFIMHGIFSPTRFVSTFVHHVYSIARRLSGRKRISELESEEDKFVLTLEVLPCFALDNITSFLSMKGKCTTRAVSYTLKDYTDLKSCAGCGRDKQTNTTSICALCIRCGTWYCGLCDENTHRWPTNWCRQCDWFTCSHCCRTLQFDRCAGDLQSAFGCSERVLQCCNDSRCGVCCTIYCKGCFLSNGCDTRCAECDVPICFDCRMVSDNRCFGVEKAECYRMYCNEHQWMIWWEGEHRKLCKYCCAEQEMKDPGWHLTNRRVRRFRN